MSREHVVEISAREFRAMHGMLEAMFDYVREIPPDRLRQIVRGEGRPVRVPKGKIQVARTEHIRVKIVP